MTGRSFPVQAIQDAIQGAYEEQSKHLKGLNDALEFQQRCADELKVEIQDLPRWAFIRRGELRATLTATNAELFVRQINHKTEGEKIKQRVRRLQQIESLIHAPWGETSVWLSIEDFDLLVNHIKPMLTEAPDA